jgi:hypothetical protein
MDSASDVLFESVGTHTTETTLEENSLWSDDGSRVCIARRGNVYDVMRPIPIDDIRTDPRWLQEKIEEHRTDDLACFLSFEVFKGLVASYVKQEWQPHSVELVESACRILLQAADDAIKRTLAIPHRYPELEQLFYQTCRSVVRERCSEAVQLTLASLEAEKYPYTSLYHDVCRRVAAERHTRLKKELETSLKLDQKGIYDTEAIKVIVDQVFQRNQQRSIEEHAAEEIEFILVAYGSVASKRILDRMPMICWEVFRSLSLSIQTSLRKVTDDTLHDCLRESEEFLCRRAQLLAERDEFGSVIAVFGSI